MEQTEQITSPSAPEIQHYRKWWSALSMPWKTAYNEVMLRRSSSEDLPDDVLHAIWTAQALRFAGPSAPYPNMTIELDNLDGVTGLNKLEIFVFTHHRLKSIAAVADLPQLKSLFVFNNQIGSLEGIEALTELRELYVQSNQIESLLPLRHLTQLQNIYCCYNRLRTLEGIGKQHIGSLKNFVCLPNDDLPDSEVIRMEREVGIRCQKG